MKKQLMQVLSCVRGIEWKSIWRKHSRRILVLGLAGTILLACMLQAEFLLGWMGTAGRMLYRCASLIIFPFRIMVSAIIPPVDHHSPVSNIVVSSVGTPYFFWAIAGSVLRLRKRGQKRTLPPSKQDEDLLKSVRFDRRQFMARSFVGAAGVATGGFGSYVSLVTPNRLSVRHYEMPVQGLPSELDGTRLMHISDTHYGPYVALDFLHEAAKHANALSPDLVLFTGDYVHLTPKSIDKGIEVLNRFQGRFGSAAVLGNHEHWEGADACRNVFNRIDLPLIDNARLFLTPHGLSTTPIPGRSLCIAGVGDYIEKEVDFDQALYGVSGDMPRIVLSHNPDAAELLTPQQRVDLMLSGHTHGGQIHLPGIGAPWNGSRYGQKYLGGVCRGPQCPVVVSRGVGIAFIPVRFRVPPELVLVVLRSTNQSGVIA